MGEVVFHNGTVSTIFNETEGNIEVFKFIEEQLNLIKKIAPDGKNAILKVSKKNADNEGFLTAVVNYMLSEEKYQAIAYTEPDNLNKVNIIIMDNDGYFNKRYVINVTYEEPESNKNIDEYSQEDGRFVVVARKVK